jgi:drug/metabolite transporter (DMT)-like permease
MYKGGLTLKILLLLIFTDFLETFTHLCFKKSALPESGFVITKPLDAFIFIKTVALSGFLWIGLMSVIAIFIIWSTVLSKIDLSVAVPVASFSYILVPLVSIIFLHEKVTALRWAGIVFILMGIILVSLSAKKDATVLK